MFDEVRWHDIGGGPVDEMASTQAGAEYRRWRFASLAPAEEFIGMELQGIVIREPEFDGDSGVCYGCDGYPTSFWVCIAHQRRCLPPPALDRSSLRSGHN